jgi:hypothetical protein
MGNKHSNEPLDRFVCELSLKDLHNTPDSDIKSKLENMLAFFRSNKEYYVECRNEEDRERNGGIQFNSLSGGGQAANSNEFAEDEEESEEDMRKTKRFCKVITFMIKLSFPNEFHDNYLLLIELMSFMGISFLIFYFSKGERISEVFLL